MNIAIVGTGYVGMSIATLLAQHNPEGDSTKSLVPQVSRMSIR